MAMHPLLKAADQSYLYRAHAHQPFCVEVEKNTLAKVSTWPWQTETLHYLTFALFLPLVMWLIQFVLRELLTG